MTLLAIFTTTMVWGQGLQNLTLLNGYTLTAYAENSYEISSVADWNALADYIAASDNNNCLGLTFKMTANIGPVSKTLGRQTGKNKSDRKRFCGTFDGNGHTLTIALNTADNWWEYNKGYCAPFAYTLNATFTNLHVAGTITTTGTWASGLVGSTGGDNSHGTCTVDHCQISVAITANYESVPGNFGNHGGIIGIAEGNATITNTWFDGKFLGKDYQYSAGFIGINKGRGTTVTDCLFNPSEINIENNNTEGSCEFVHSLNGGNHTLSRAYWVSHFGEISNAQGQRVSSVQPDPNQYSYNTISAVDGNNYYIVLKSVTWGHIEEAIASEEADFFNLASDVVAGTEDVALVIPTGKTFELRLNGHTLDRGLMLESVKTNGYVIKVEAGAMLTIGAGTITGGNNNGNAGGIYNAGTLNINGTTFTGNYCKGHGAGIYNTGTLNINSATITDNSGRQQANRGGGVYVTASATFNVEGNVQINNNYSTYVNSTQYNDVHNVYLDGSNVINVTGSLSGSLIGVEGHAGAVTSGLNDNGDLSNFISSDDYVAFYKENEIVLVAKETHDLVINAYTVSSGATDGWYLIASPVSTTPSEVTNMKSNKYDLYRFNQVGANGEWENYKKHTNGFEIVPGQGYLYANNKSVTLTFTGLPYEGDGEIPLVYDDNAAEGMKGINLVGNPFGTNATLDSDHDFYVMNANRTNIIAGTDRTIGVMEGVIVIAKDANDDHVTFTPSSTGKSNEGNRVVLNVADNGNVIDRAIVRFGQGNNLSKFQLFENSTKLYIAQNGKDYAIAKAEAQGEMPVSFKAAQDGTYTISVNPEEMEMNYLHLIDNLTGANVDLLTTPNYTFSAKTDDYASRFRLVFSAQENDAEHFAFVSNGEIIVNNAEQATIEVIDMTGRTIARQYGEQTMSTNGIAAGVYVIRLTNGDQVKTQKIIIK